MNWRVLVVDDDPDIHAITKLALRNKHWRNQGFSIVSAGSKSEAIQILHSEQPFEVAIIDVVMEQEDSGLELCEVIRDTCPRSTRIILRTGQPGRAPEEQILNDYDIDYYLAKSDISPERLFSVLRACLRSSQDISTLLAYGRQLQSFTKTLRDVSTTEDLVVFMREALRFLELKHNCKTTFSYDLTRGVEGLIHSGGPDSQEVSRQAGTTALEFAHKQNIPFMTAHPAGELGLDESSFIIIFETRERAVGEANTDASPILGGLAFSMKGQNASSVKARHDFVADARLFIENWCIAFSALSLRERLIREQHLREQMYHDRLEGIATMVTGVAHELNTPLGVARTAGSIIDDCVTAISGDSLPETLSEGMRDVLEASHLMNKNLDRAHRLIKSFRQLSASQLSDECVETDLRMVIEDCIETMGPELRKKSIVSHIRIASSTDSGWTGYPGHLSQVLINLTQNAIRYAFPENAGGNLTISAYRIKDDTTFRIEFSDDGIGVDGEILPRIFDAFVTSGRGMGGTGLGLAITHNIVTNLLKGQIACDSRRGEGTMFTIDFPVVCQKEKLKEALPYTF